MSKLTQVRKALEENPDIVVVRIEEKNYLPERSGFWSHTVNFCVAPRTGIYDTQALQELMMSLVPELDPTSRNDFRESQIEMWFGKLYFDEVIGTEVIHHDITLTDESLFSCDGFVDGKQSFEITVPVRRRIWVRLFPNPSIATTRTREDYDLFHMDKRELEQHRKATK